MFFFLVLILFILFTIEPTNLKKSYSWICEKHDQALINLTNVFYFIANFQITSCLMKWNGCVSLLNILHNCTNIYNKATIYVNELILSPFDPFGIKCRKLNIKNSGNVFLGHLGGSVFYIFRRLHSIMCVCWGGQVGCGWPSIPFRIFVDYVTIFNSSPMQHLRWNSLWWKIGNSWKLVGCCYIELRLK